MDLQQQYLQAHPEQRLDSASFKKIAKMSPEKIAALPEKIRQDYFATARWHALRRMSLETTEGIVIGSRSISELTGNEDQTP